jgi:hypothetical protein
MSRMNPASRARLLMAVCLGLAASYSLSANAYASSPYDEFPLAKDVPGKTFAVLGEGKLPNRTRWAAYASRVSAGERGRQQPCISVAKITRFGGYGNARGCGPLAPRQPGQPPVYVSISGSYDTRPGGPVIGESVFALTVAPSVRRVELTYSTGGTLTRTTKLFNARQRAKTGLTKFRYVALGQQRDVCVAAVTGYSQNGTVLLEEETQLCPA